MTEARIVQIEASFDLCVDNISKLNNFSSPKVMVQGIPWNFDIRKYIFDNEESLAVYLYCKKGDKSRDWSITASWTIQLISSRGKPNTIEKELEPYIFDYTGDGYGFHQIIKWKDLFDVEKGYVENDTIKLKIKVNVPDPNDKPASKLQVEFNKCCDESSHTTLKLTVTNIDKLMAVRTPEFKLQNQSWHLNVFKHPVKGLGLRFYSMELPTSPLVTYKTKIDLRIKSTISGVKDFETTQNIQLKHTACVNIYSIISWDELFKPENGYIVNNSVTLEVKIKVEKVEAAAPNANKRHATALEMECPICFADMKDQDLSSTDCGHLFCSECIKKVVSDNKPCPSCNTKLNLTKVRRLYLPLAKKD